MTVNLILELILSGVAIIAVVKYLTRDKSKDEERESQFHRGPSWPDGHKSDKGEKKD